MKAWLAGVGLLAACVGAGGGVPAAPVPSGAAVETSLFLIGDAGAPSPRGEPVLHALADALGKAVGDRVVVFLGDNVYPRGMPDSSAPDRAEMELRLDTQIAVVTDAGARGIFVPGNHDWANHGADGWGAIRRQGRWVARKAPAVTLLPADGCPGPAVVDIGLRLRLILLDTQWWLYGGPKPRGPDSGCRAADDGAVADSLRADLAAAGERTVLVAAHHPLASAGEHGGFFRVEDHVFPLRAVRSWLWVPLPGLGSIYPLARQNGISSQDQSSPVNRRMVEMLEAAMRDHPPLVWASGHEHNLEVLEGTVPRWLLVSGAGIFGHQGPAFRRTAMRFGSGDAGFMRLDVLADGRVRLGVLAVDREGRSRERFSMWLEGEGRQ
jgi:calcineurin-like phosphoesterase family protein